MSYLCRIQFEVSDGDAFDQFYVVDEDELSKLKKLDYEFEGGCCSQGGCFICRVGGCVVTYCDHIKVKNAALIEFFNVDPIMDLGSLLEKC